MDALQTFAGSYERSGEPVGDTTMSPGTGSFASRWPGGEGEMVCRSSYPPTGDGTIEKRLVRA